VLININHAPSAQDLLHQFMAERGVNVAVVAEPHRVPPDHARWTADASKSAVAITWRTADDSLACTPLESGANYAAVRWGKWMVVGVYLPPRLSSAEFEDRLEKIRGCINRHPWPVIVAGNFNAHSVAWGSRQTNYRGRVVEDWAASTGLELQNTGPESTCVRPQGESIIDLIWTAPLVAAKVINRRVVTEVHSGSDHLYVQMDLECTSEQV